MMRHSNHPPATSQVRATANMRGQPWTRVPAAFAFPNAAHLATREVGIKVAL